MSVGLDGESTKDNNSKESGACKVCVKCWLVLVACNVESSSILLSQRCASLANIQHELYLSLHLSANEHIPTAKKRHKEILVYVNVLVCTVSNPNSFFHRLIAVLTIAPRTQFD